MFGSLGLQHPKGKIILFWGILLLCYSTALFVRFEMADSIQVYSDSLSPYLAATRFLNLGYSDPPNPEADHWLWITAVPQIVISDSLEMMFACRVFISGLVAPLGAAVVWHMAKRDRALSAWLGGTTLALDQGLMDTLISSFRGYMAPEWIGLASLLFAIGFRIPKVWCFVPAILIIAGGHHPLALGTLLCLPLFLIWNLRDWQWIVLSCLCVSLPRLFWMYKIAQCDAGGFDCFTQIATGSSEQYGYWELFYRAYKEHFGDTWSYVGLALSMRIFFSERKVRFWVVSLLLGVTILGMTLMTLLEL